MVLISRIVKVDGFEIWHVFISLPVVLSLNCHKKISHGSNAMYIMQFIPLVASRGALPPSRQQYLRHIPPSIFPSNNANTVRPICLGANVPKRGPRKPEVGTPHTEAEKQVALEASLSASELGPTKKEAPDGGKKGWRCLSASVPQFSSSNSRSVT
jgi:hypothetical protein